MESEDKDSNNAKHIKRIYRERQIYWVKKQETAKSKNKKDLELKNTI